MDRKSVVNIGEQRFNKLMRKISFILTRQILSGSGGRLVPQ